MRFLAVLLLAACGADPDPKGADTGDAPEPDTEDTDTDDPVDTDTVDPTDTDTDTDPPTTPQPAAWTPGPALPACTPQTGAGDLVALSGVLLRPTGPEAGVVVYSRASGEIVCSGASCDTAGAEVVCTEGVITPGLINAHDHMQYNVLGPWRHADLYGDRYEWQSDGDYWDFREAYDAIEDAYVCEITKWAELRHLAGGATAAVGASGGACIDILVRNLEEGDASHGLDGFDLTYSSGQAWYIDEGDAADDAADLASGALEAVINHVAEGVDGRVRAEIDHMFDVGAVGDGQVFVHATDATVEQLARMAETGTGLVWSPQSNLDLYAQTTLGLVAWRLGVPMALGPDWSWSGSATVPRELGCAWDFLATQGAEITDVDLWAMTTSDAARVLGLDGVLGTLQPGAEADLAVFPWSAEPYRAVIEAGPEDTWLTVIDGDAKYGKPELVDLLAAEPAWCEEVLACSETRSICAQQGASGDDAQTYAFLEAELTAALGATSMPAGLEYAAELYPLWACAEVRDTCDALAAASANDADGDGIADAADLCPSAYDPLQGDHDGDGVGDVCDPCPLTGGAVCKHDPEDMDDDGIRADVDLCPYVADTGADADGDGKGDACDPCPAAANPGDAGCPVSLRAVRDPADPGHVPVGSAVEIDGVVVTAVGASGFFVQDPAETEWAGIYVYGDTSPAVGDVVTVAGVVEEYFGQAEIGDPTVTITGTAAVPAPVAVAACDIGTGGPDAERYEGMLVQVGPVSVSDANPDAPSDFNEWEVEGCLRVDDMLCPSCWADQPAAGAAYTSLTGVLYYSFSNTKVLPRDAADLAP